MFNAFLWCATATLGVLGLVWKSRDFANIFIKTCLIAMFIFGGICLLNTYGVWNLT